MKSMDELLNEIEKHIPYQEALCSQISSGSVGWHIEHSLLTINLVIKGFKASNPLAYKPKPNIKRIYVMTTGKIPRGKINAPMVVQPRVLFTCKSLSEHLLITRVNYQSLQMEDSRKFFTHPFLGDMRLMATQRFLRIHTAHHLFIISDIVGSG